jgi:hypothetical protein
MELLKFSPANAKTKALQTYLPKGRKVYSFDIPAGETCPAAKLCRSYAIEDKNGKATILDGPFTLWRCFSASQEVLYPSLRRLHQHNLRLLTQAKTIPKMAGIILTSIPKNAGIIRLHVSGDFYNYAYFLAWIRVALARPDIRIYCYTKNLSVVKRWIDEKNTDESDLSIGKLLPNFAVTASYGGIYDSQIPIMGIRSATVFFSEEQAEENGLSLDHTDEYALNFGGSFGLLIHGPQPAKSPASAALSKLRKIGKGGYSRV